MSSNYHYSIKNSGANTATTTGPRAKCDQVIFEALCKACEIIVGSRTSISALNSNNNSNNSASSTRFNLQIPEVAGVRSILAQYRLQLHVPIRLDVYYQHPPEKGETQGKRELLERWCLEYKTSSTECFLQAEGIVTNDPMVALTHVCKRIVLWLRTLYCWARLLPAQGIGSSSPNNQKIGFSMYVNADGSDDKTELTSHQGFMSQSQQNGIVTTPYGQLAWQVLYSPSSKIQRLIPTRTPSVRIQTPAAPHSRPIPMKTNNNTAVSRSNINSWDKFAPHSAPTSRPPTYTERSQQKRMEAAQQQQRLHQQQQQQQYSGKSYDPSRLYYNRSSGETKNNNDTASRPPTLFRRYTDVPNNSHGSSPAHSSDENPPGRVLSGLSLALMMASNDNDKTGEDSPSRVSNGNNSKQQSSSTSSDDAFVAVHDENEETVEEKARRAALHEMPPHLLEQQSRSPNAALSGEYGYGYNNHIPWQKIHPSNTKPAVVEEKQSSVPYGRALSSSPRSCSPSPLHQMLPTPPTPPGAAFLGVTPPINSMAHLIPPRNRSDSVSSKTVTPPFQPRPAGFVHDAPAIPMEPQQQLGKSSSEQQQQQQFESIKGKSSLLPRPGGMTAFDSLRSSPFQQQNHVLQDNRSALFSSLSHGAGLAPDISSNFSNILAQSSTGSSDLRRSLWSSKNAAADGGSMSFGPGPLVEEEYYNEEMPFAVDLPSTSSQIGGGSSSQKSTSLNASKTASASFLGNSSALTSLAQQCAAPTRLKFFDKQQQKGTVRNSNEQRGPDDTEERGEEDVMSSLAAQLQEFRAFGASLHTSAVDTDQLAGSANSSTSTPISLKS